MKSKKATIKKMIKSECQSTFNRRYKTTYKDIKKYFHLINDSMFYGQLSPFNDVQIKDLTSDNVYGQVCIHDNKQKGTRWFVLEMSDYYTNKEEFLNTLGHDMIHLWQMQNCGDTGNHNALFFYHKKQLKQIGLGNI